MSHNASKYSTAETMVDVTLVFQASALLPQNGGPARLGLLGITLGPGPQHSPEPQPARGSSCAMETAFKPIMNCRLVIPGFAAKERQVRREISSA